MGGAAGELVADDHRPGGHPHPAGQFVGLAGDVSAELLRQPLLLRVAGGHHQWPAAIYLAALDAGVDRGEGEQAEGAGTDDHGLGAVVALGRVHGARSRLDYHRRLVVEVVGYVDELERVGDHLGAPAPAGVGAEPGLQSGFEVAERHPLTEVDPPGVARRTHGGDAPYRAGQDWHQHDTAGGATTVRVDDVGHDLVPGRERVAHEGVEVGRGGAVDQGQVAATDSCEAWPQS